jgi:hypothetical protein
VHIIAVVSALPGVSTSIGLCYWPHCALVNSESVNVIGSVFINERPLLSFQCYGERESRLEPLPGELGILTSNISISSSSPPSFSPPTTVVTSLQ